MESILFLGFTLNAWIVIVTVLLVFILMLDDCRIVQLCHSYRFADPHAGVRTWRLPVLRLHAGRFLHEPDYMGGKPVHHPVVIPALTKGCREAWSYPFVEV